MVVRTNPCSLLLARGVNAAHGHRNGLWEVLITGRLEKLNTARSAAGSTTLVRGWKIISYLGLFCFFVSFDFSFLIFTFGVSYLYAMADGANNTLKCIWETIGARGRIEIWVTRRFLIFLLSQWRSIFSMMKQERLLRVFHLNYNALMAHYVQCLHPYAWSLVGAYAK